MGESAERPSDERRYRFDVAKHLGSPNPVNCAPTQLTNRARAKELFNLGFTCYLERESDQAIAYFTEAIRLDIPAGNRGYRGPPWKVAFWDVVLNKGVWIFSDLPAYTTPENASKLHPDPHPQFVCRDRYIVSTFNRGDGRMDVAVTPVAPLAALTAEKDASALLPQRLSDL